MSFRTNGLQTPKKRNIALIENIAQAHGSTWDGQLLGTFGDLGCVSTHERKLITTGEGGFVLTNKGSVPPEGEMTL